MQIKLSQLNYNFQVQHYILVVQATDGGTPALSSTVTVYCNVVDINDNAPIFEAGPRSAELMENATIGSVVLTTSATDLDSGDNGHVVYSILSGDEAEDFGIADNGTLYTRRLLDRENKSVYNLVLEAADSPGTPANPLTTTIQVCEEFYIYIVYTFNDEKFSDVLLAQIGGLIVFHKDVYTGVRGDTRESVLYIRSSLSWYNVRLKLC